jgi:Fic family protein
VSFWRKLFAKAPSLYKTADEKARLEARNGLLQFDEVLCLIDKSIASRKPFKLTPEMLRRLHHAAIHDIYKCAGTFRKIPVYLTNATHQPPPHEHVRGLVDEMCTYVNSNPHRSPIHVASYLMWRLNWVHPFAGGNGRTSRAVSYLALCAKLGYRLPGSKMIPAQIVTDRDPYYAALRQADNAWTRGVVDVSDMEVMVQNLLASQLVDLLDAAGQSGTL